MSRTETERRARPGAPGAVQHVLMTADAVGGVWTFVSDLARGLGDRGVQVSLAVLGPAPSERQRAAVRQLANVRVFERPGRLEWMADPWDDVARTGEWLMDLAESLRPDVVHLNGLCHGALPWTAPVLVTGHSCVVSWWRAVHGTEPPVSWARYADEVTRSLQAADLVAAPTAAMLGMLNAEYGPLRSTAVLRNGRYVGGSAVREKEPFVLSAGRLWDEAKNVQAVCAAAPLVAWPTRVAGERRSPDGAAFACEGVEFLGRLESDDLAAWMARASIYVLPARYEPFGLSILEAASAGCALVLGDIRSLREVWDDAAVYVPPDNRRALASVVQALIDDPERRAAMAARASARAAAMTGERMADDYLTAFRQLAAAGCSRRPAAPALQAV